MKPTMRVPCSYQGGKQRIASAIVDQLLNAVPHGESLFYDLCCGSGAISIELVNRGIDPSRIYMLDISTWGDFWSAIGSGCFRIDLFDRYLSGLPDSKRDYKAHIQGLSIESPSEGAVELYPILQANSFGGKQIWRNGESWANAFFRSYWEPTATSIRRSPANPMQPGPDELRSRIKSLIKGMQGVNAKRADIMNVLNKPLPYNAIVYVDPPYRNTTKYAFDFDLKVFIERFCKMNQIPLFVSEGVPLNSASMLLKFGGAKGGISGTKKGKHEEWLSRF